MLLFIYVLQFYPNTTATVFLSLLELSELATPLYLFTFAQRVQNKVVRVDLVATESTERSQRFDIDVSVVFAGCTPGDYLYTVQEFTEPVGYTGSRIEAILAGTLNIIEVGQAHLHPVPPDLFTQRQAATQFIQRQ